SLLRGEECVERRWWMGTVVAQPGCELTKGSFCFAFPVGCRSCTVQKRNCTSNSRGVTQCMTGNPRERQTKSFPRSVHNPAEPPPSSPCTIPTSQKREREYRHRDDSVSYFRRADISGNPSSEDSAVLRAPPARRRGACRHHLVHQSPDI
ncbi:unnamed protein product, partial [Musa hybrid cultivar]